MARRAEQPPSLELDPGDHLCVDDRLFLRLGQQAVEDGVALGVALLQAKSPGRLVAFEQALAARHLTGPAAEVRIARWMVAWSLRKLDRAPEALAIQRELKARLLAAGESDPYVDEELELLARVDPAS